jgi:hypothetical protein
MGLISFLHGRVVTYPCISWANRSIDAMRSARAVVDNATGKDLPKIAVNLRLGLENRRTVQQETDSQGSTCFTVAALAHPITSVDAFSIHYHSVAADPQITHLPEIVTIRMRHLSWLESLRYVFQGD